MESYFSESLHQFKEGQIVNGSIIDMAKGIATIDIGFKSEGTVHLNEFPDSGKDLAVGDTVEVFLERIEDNDGNVVLSKDKANKIKLWDELVKTYEADEIIDGTVIAKAKGGLTVDIGLKAFLPGSQIDLRPIRNLEKLIGEKFQMRIIKMNKKRGNIVLSRRVLLEEQRKQSRSETLQKLEEGNLVDGIVKNITEYGVFIDLGGIDGLLHITDMSWGRVNHPSEMFSIGLLHCNVGGIEGHDNYAPCTVDDLLDGGFDYWALGHIHQRQSLGRGNVQIEYPGNIQGRDVGELDEKGCLLVTVAVNGQVEHHFKPLDVVRWKTRDIPVDEFTTLDDLMGGLYEAIDELRSGADGRDIVARLALTGRSELTREIRDGGGLQAITDELNPLTFSTSPWVWIESIEDRTRPPIDIVAMSERDDF
ncbi:MAG: S1 RNA-binding domain-containing protein, partial [Nitrospinae bacterium]|nr:S1 RNA-binding domain-containing protein [Nitrospinota bacterium]